jgi:alpha-methylacyl-CoA racemase
MFARLQPTAGAVTVHASRRAAGTCAAGAAAANLSNDRLAGQGPVPSKLSVINQEDAGRPCAGPLAGLRIVDLTRLAPGPFATTLLGDLGAEVVTIEIPAGARPQSDPEEVPGHGGAAARARGTNPLFRSRRCLTLDLKRADDLEVLLRLIDRADVFIEGFRPGVCDRLGLGYEALAARRPSLVYCSITGYGQQGADSRRAGHDLNYLAETGLLAVTSRDGQRPGIPLNVVADLAAGGLVAAFGILAALRARDHTGRGCHVDVSMYESLLSMLAPAAAWHDAGAPDPSWASGLLSGGAPFYDCYRTADGRWLAVAALEAQFFTALCDALDRPDLVALRTDVESWPRLRSELERTFAAQPLERWLQRLAHLDATVSPVLTMPEAFARAAAQGLIAAPATVGPIPRLRGYSPHLGPASQPDGRRAEILRELDTDPAGD